MEWKEVSRLEAFAIAFSQISLGWVSLMFLAALGLLGFIFSRFERTRPYMGQLLILSGICLLALVFFILTFSLKVRKADQFVTAATMPRVWIAGLVPVAVLAFVSILNGSTPPDKPFGRWQMVLMVIVAVFSSVYLFDYIGYYISSALFLVLMMVMMRERKWTRLLLVPLGWCAFTYFVFEKLLYMSLPAGRWITGLLG